MNFRKYNIRLRGVSGLTGLEHIVYLEWNFLKNIVFGRQDLAFVRVHFELAAAALVQIRGYRHAQS